MTTATATERGIRFHGGLGVAPAIAQFAASITYSRYDPTTLDVDILWLGGDSSTRMGSAMLLPSAGGVVVLQPEDHAHPTVELLGVWQVSTEGNRSTVAANGMRVGLGRAALGRDARYIVKAELRPSGILSLPRIREMSFTGEIKNRDVITGKAEVETDLGTLEACQRYDHFTTTEIGDEVMHSVRRAAITGDLTVPAGSSLADVDGKLQQACSEICVALSLCYRQPVNYYEIEYIPNPNHQPPAEARDATVRYRWNSIAPRCEEDELIDMRDLVSGGLGRLVTAIRNSARKESVERAIRFLSASYLAPLETAYFMAFSAMETVIDACTEKEDGLLLKSGQWKRVEHKLRESLDLLCLGDPVELMKLKLPELRRAPFASCVMAACRRLGPKVDDLWRGIAFEEGLARAINVRNTLFHAAHAESLQEMHSNLVRVRTLTERLILKKLQWPDNAIWRWYDQNLKRIPPPRSIPKDTNSG